VLDVRPLAEADREAAHALRQEVFQHRPDAYDGEVDRDYYAPIRRRLGAYHDGRLVGHLAAWDMGQWFGGRLVPMGGIAGVAVAAEARGAGTASALLERSLRMMREAGDAISTLYPANIGLYRSCGWEPAGVYPLRSTSTAALMRLPRPSAKVVVRAADRADLPAIEAAYGEVAPGESGMLARSTRYAARITGRPDSHTYVAEVGKVLTGYVWTGREPATDRQESYTTVVHEWLALDLDALLALWRVVGSSRPISRTVTYVDSPYDSLAMLLHDPGRGQDVYAQPDLEFWMTRLVDAAAAVDARGFPAAVDAEVSLDLVDDRAAWNAGRWVLRVAGGRGTLERGGRGDVRLQVGTLSAIYTGWTDPFEAARLGLLPGAGRSDLAQLAAVFAGRTPWLRSYF
jgi:predicted acetyltransferase